MDYKVLTAQERMAMARDFVRDAEAAYYRLELTNTADPARDERLKTAKTRLDELHTEFDALVKEAGTET